MLDVRCINDGIDLTRAQMLDKYVVDRHTPYQLKSLDDYDEFKRHSDAKRKTQSSFVRDRLMRNVTERSNGESAMVYFTDSIKENALYLLDEPENSLSAEPQLDLCRYIEDSVRHVGCQFIITTHSPFLLSCPHAVIYDVDSDPPCKKDWTSLKNVRTYYNLFRTHASAFEEEE